ncbi:MAG: amidohydrolase family protein [Planctomycetes bacterium]|nr:amidohydrolase family protein [Planctomycetota bacterium]
MIEPPHHRLFPSRRGFLGSAAGAAALAAFGCGPVREPDDEGIIDIHQHTDYGGQRDKNWKQTAPGRTHDQLLAHQKLMGVTRTLLLPAGREVLTASTHQGSGNGLQGTCTGNEVCLQLAKAHPEHFVFGANEVPDLPDAAEVIEKYLKAGAVVIGEQKFGVECDSADMQKLYTLAGAYRVPILMHWQHTTYNSGFDRFHKMLEKYPKVTFIGHAQTWWANIDKDHKDQSVLYPKTKVTPGGWTDRYLSDYPNMFGDLSAGSGQNALSRDENQAREFLQRHASKLMFGSDCIDTLGTGPTCIGAGTIALIRKLAPSPEIRRKLLHDNAKSLFRL